MEAQSSSWPTGLGFQQRKTAQQIADWVRREGVDYRPISESRAIQCKHGAYGWDDCMTCAAQQLADDIENGKWHEPAAPACGKHCTTGGRPTGFHCVLPVDHDGHHRHELGGTYP